MSNPLTILLINLGAYLLAEKLFIRIGRKGWFHPLFTGSVLIFLIIQFSHIDLKRYMEHSEILKMLLAPFTVALAVPLSRQLKYLRQLAAPLLITLMVGGLMAGS